MRTSPISSPSFRMTKPPRSWRGFPPKNGTDFERLDDERQAAIVPSSAPSPSRQIAVEMSSDERADLIKDCPKCRGQCSPISSRSIPVAGTRTLAQWPEHSAGRLMTTDYLSVTTMMTVSEVFSSSAERAAKRDDYYVYALSAGNAWTALPRRATSFSPIQSRSSRRSSPPRRHRSPEWPGGGREESRKYDLAAIPVVDGRGTLRCVIHRRRRHRRPDPRADRRRPEAGRRRNPSTRAIFRRLLDVHSKTRDLALILFVGEFFTGLRLAQLRRGDPGGVQAELLRSAAHPTVGNSGSNPRSLIIRRLAVGEVKLADWWRVGAGSSRKGSCLGLVLAAVGMMRVMMWGDGLRFGTPVGGTLIAIVVMGCVVGSMLPLLCGAGFDPATTRAPSSPAWSDCSGS